MVTSIRKDFRLLHKGECMQQVGTILSGKRGYQKKGLSLLHLLSVMPAHLSIFEYLEKLNKNTKN